MSQIIDSDKVALAQDGARVDTPAGLTSTSRRMPDPGSLLVLEANATPWMPHALRIMIDGYFPYVPAYLPHQADEIYQELFALLGDDPYRPLQRSYTFVALLPTPQSPHQQAIAGVLRLIVGAERKEPDELAPVPAFDLLDVHPTWPHRQEEQSDALIGEFCRLTIAKPFRRLSVALTAALAHAALRKATELSLSSIYAIMPPKVHHIARRALLPFELITGTLPQDTPHAHRFFDALPGYWQAQAPDLYRIWTNAFEHTEGGSQR